ncbi:hypothetical protein F5146DRAFT_1138714 [Armillaria mellea]|nr:hypothetical protein F5146DRAFT_1138714 [Armillaria mellea]
MALAFLNWIAMVFVQEPRRENFAVALSAAEDSLILHVARGSSSKAASQSDYIQEFVRLANEIFARQNAIIGMNQSVDTTQDIARVTDIMVDHAWPRFVRKVQALRRLCLVPILVGPLEILLTSWSQWRSDSSKGSESSSDMKKLMEMLSFTDAITTFREAFRILVEEIEPPPRRATPSKRIIWKVVSYSFGAMRRRLWRIQFYLFGAANFVGGHMRYVQNAFPKARGGPDGPFTCRWIKSEEPITVSLTNPPRVAVADVLQQNGYQPADDNINAVLEQFVCDPDWTSGSPQTVNIHAVVQMINYMDASGMRVVGDTVGSGKRMCLHVLPL